MNTPKDTDDNIAEQLSQQFVARVALKMIRRIVTGWEEEEKQKTAILRAVFLTFLWVIGALLILMPIVLSLYFYQLNPQWLAGSLLVGVLGAIALVWWGKRHKRNGH